MTGWKSTHALDFENAPFRHDVSCHCFRIGTCEGLWTVKEKSYVIIAVTNRIPGNGHFDDVFEWFERSCRRDGYSLVVAAIVNKRLFRHLIEKRGFVDIGDDNVEKKFDT